MFFMNGFFFGRAISPLLHNDTGHSASHLKFEEIHKVITNIVIAT